MRLAQGAGAAAAAVLLLTGCGGSHHPAASASAASVTIGPGGVQEVTIHDVAGLRFSPSSIRVHPGRVQLTMVNDTAVPHTFTLPGIVDTGAVNGGQRRTVTFTVVRTGSYDFYCAYHQMAGMTGTLVVQ